MKRQVKSPEKHDNVTPEIAKKAVASVMYKTPERRLMMADREGFSRSEPTLSDIQSYLSEHGLVACPRSEAHYVFSKDADGSLKQVSECMGPVDADSYARELRHRKPDQTYFIMVLEP
jgi:hypothetical protein